MTQFNLINQPFISTLPQGPLTLPGVLAALARDEVESFPALRVHQAMFWHMFLVQLGALALHKAGENAIPLNEARWREVLRGLTSDFPNDEPWHLIVDDWAKPAFMQAPVPEDIKLANTIATPDGLDILITSKNHDLKQNLARKAEPEHWLFALITLQTGEGYGGAGNQGIARMNGGSSSRPMLTLAPVPPAMQKTTAPRLGAWFCRDLRVLLETREDESVLDFQDEGGLGLTWLAPWPETEQLQTRQLDQWFIEVCRRIRLCDRDGRVEASKGTSKETRINGKHLRGNLGDPWSPIEKTDGKSLTLSDTGNFDYKRLVDLLLSGEWALPLLAKPFADEVKKSSFILVAQALARGNSKTGGFMSRFVPLHGKTAQAMATDDQRKALDELAKAHMAEIDKFDKALSYALVLIVAGGEKSKIKREHYAFALQAKATLDRFADDIFFAHLWARFEGVGAEGREVEKLRFIQLLWAKTQKVFEEALPTMPCPSLFRPRAEARARAVLRGMLMKEFDSYLKSEFEDKEVTDDAA